MAPNSLRGFGHHTRITGVGRLLCNNYPTTGKKTYMKILSLVNLSVRYLTYDPLPLTD